MVDSALLVDLPLVDARIIIGSECRRDCKHAYYASGENCANDLFHDISLMLI
jgi:hypothetical protein